MSTITTLLGTDAITTADSMTKINANFNALNADKVETSAIDTDTALTANSDAKIPSQKAVKAYVDATGGQTFLVPTGGILPYAGSTAPANYLLCDGSAVSRSTYATLLAVIGTTYGVGDGVTSFNLPDLRGSVPLGAGTRVRTMTFDGASAVDPTTDIITVTSNDWLHNGQAVALTGSSLPTGLSAATYYVIRLSATTIKLATSVANANEGTAVDITADGSGTCTLTQTLTARTVGQNGGEETHSLSDAEMPSHVHNIPDTQSASGSEWSWSPNDISSTRGSGSGTLPTGSDTPHNILPPYTVFNYIIKT